MKKYKFILISALFLLASAFGVLTTGVSTARAEEKTNVELSLCSPAEFNEYFSLLSPQAVCENDDYFVFVSYFNENNTLFVYDKTAKTYAVYPNSSSVPLESVGNQSYLFTTNGDVYFVYQNSLILYSIKISDPTVTTALRIKDTSENDVSSYFFAINNDYVVIAREKTVSLYSVDGVNDVGRIIIKPIKEKNFENGKITMNTTGTVFYSLSSTLYIDSVENFKSGNDPLST
ncbi:MAG: hypothetical protein MJ072_01490, partial [Clostridia bacterium]|nr:hypothetical protein [Clostridia bacterium]